MRTLLSTLAVTLLATSALAQGIATDPVNSGDLPFKPVTAIGDGVSPTAVTTPAPAAAPVAQGASFGLAKVFDEADTNRDGVVTKEEFMAKAERHFGMADTNKDGKITREEMQAQQNAIMQQMQKNMFGSGGMAGKVNQFLGGTGMQLAPATPAAPTVPTVTAPTTPTVYGH